MMLFKVFHFNVDIIVFYSLISLRKESKQELDEYRHLVDSSALLVYIFAS